MRKFKRASCIVCDFLYLLHEESTDSLGTTSYGNDGVVDAGTDISTLLLHSAQAMMSSALPAKKPDNASNPTKCARTDSDGDTILSTYKWLAGVPIECSSPRQPARCVQKLKTTHLVSSSVSNPKVKGQVKETECTHLCFYADQELSLTRELTQEEATRGALNVSILRLECGFSEPRGPFKPGMRSSH